MAQGGQSEAKPTARQIAGGSRKLDPSYLLFVAKSSTDLNVIFLENLSDKSRKYNLANPAITG